MNMEMEIPNDWEVKKLGDLGKCIRGLTYSPDDVADNGLLVLRSSNIQNGKLTYDDNVFVKIDVGNEYISTVGDILICVRNGSKRLLGKSATITGCGPKSTHGAFMTVFRGEYNSYIKQLINSDMFFTQVSIDIGATINSINNSNLLKYRFPFPLLPEQKQIAKILTSVDEVIATTETQINKLKDLKKGMMNELLTKGIGHTEFKDSVVGRIPVGWDVVSINTVSKLASGGTPDRKIPQYWDGKIAWVKTGEINYTTINKTVEKISEEGLKNSSAKLITKGAVLMAMYGQGVTRGKVAILGINATLNQACLAIMPNNSLFNRFLFYYLTNQYEKLRSLVQEGTQKNLNSAIVKDVLIPIPSSDEQQKIASILTSIDTNIEQKQTKLTQTKNLKKSLMADLLTGRVRVKVN